jgi:hypothetical protein
MFLRLRSGAFHQSLWMWCRVLLARGQRRHTLEMSQTGSPTLGTARKSFDQSRVLWVKALSESRHGTGHLDDNACFARLETTTWQLFFAFGRSPCNQVKQLSRISTCGRCSFGKKLDCFWTDNGATDPAINDVDEIICSASFKHQIVLELKTRVSWWLLSHARAKGKRGTTVTHLTKLVKTTASCTRNRVNLKFQSGQKPFGHHWPT